MSQQIIKDHNIEALKVAATRTKDGSRRRPSTWQGLLGGPDRPSTWQGLLGGPDRPSTWQGLLGDPDPR